MVGIVSVVDSDNCKNVTVVDGLDPVYMCIHA